MNEPPDVPAIDEEVRRRFESDWANGSPLPISQYLPDWSEPRRHATLEELVLIDLEFRWTLWAELQQPSEETVVAGAVGGAMPDLAGYLTEFPVLAETGPLARLMDEHLGHARRHGVGIDPTRLMAVVPEASWKDEWFAEAPVAEAEKLPQTWGDYELLERLGEGAMGVVYRAKHQPSGRIVALKRMIDLGVSVESQGSMLARFMAEASATAKLDHDHIVPVYDVGLVDQSPFYTMQLIEGGPLSDRIAGEPLEAMRAARLLEGVANGVAAAHEAGIVHRDIKPANILLDARSGRAKVADFGLVRTQRTDHTMTKTGQLVGTPAYMAPEQARDARGADARSDVYALGATLYHLCTGRPPFQAANLVMQLKQVMHDEPVGVRRLNPAIPRDLETICLRCLEKDPRKRFDSAADLAADLGRFLAGEPVASRPVSTFGRVTRWASRNRWVAGWAAVACTAMILGVIALAIGLREARRQLGKYENMYQQARQAVDGFYLRLSEDSVFDQPGMSETRRAYLLEAMGYYRRFLDERGDTMSLLDAASTRIKIGLLTAALGSPDAARDYFERAIGELEQIPASERSLLAIQEFGEAWNGLGQVHLDAGEAKEAAEAFSRSIQWRDTLRKSQGSNPLSAARELANAMMNRGLALRVAGDLAGAEKWQKEAQQLRDEQLQRADDGSASAAPADTDSDLWALQVDRAKGEFNLGVLIGYALVGEAEPPPETIQEATRHLDSATQQFAVLSKQHPFDPELRRREIECIRFNGWLASHWSDEYETLLQRAAKEAADLAADYPTTKAYRIDLARVQQTQVEALLEWGDVDGAEQSLALHAPVIEELMESPDPRVHWLKSGFHFFQAQAYGQTADETRMFQELEKCRDALQAFLKTSPDDRVAQERATLLKQLFEVRGQ